MNADPNSIVINLDTLESTDVLDRRNLIFQDQYDLLVSKIRRKAQENSDWLKTQAVCGGKKKELDEETRGVPSCFFIDGTRGSGKSTLMRAVRDALIKGKFQENEQNKICLYPLADVDPTELGKGENFFLYLLSRIYRLLDERFKKNDICDAKVGQIRGAMEALRKMSGGLQVLMDSDGALKESDNPDFFLEACVDKCADSSLLRKTLCELLGNVAKIVDKEIFLVTIDDADLNFSKCEDVLEYVRKYMQTPRLVFLFAGDMQLYSHIVRGMHIDNFAEKQLKYDESHKEHRNQMIDQLEDQYLLKLFPVDNRVNTYNLKKVLETGKKIYIERYEGDKKKETFLLYLQEQLTSRIMPDAEKNLQDAIIQLPTRSVLFLMRYLCKNPYVDTDQDSSTYIWKGLENVFLTSLVKYNVDYLQLGSENVDILQKTLFRYCSAVQRWNADLAMSPADEDLAAKQVVLYLGGAVEQSTQRVVSKLSYWCACFPAWQAIREFYSRTYETLQTRNFVENCLKIGNDSVKSTWANLACATMAPNLNSPILYGRGTVCLFNEDRLKDNENGKVYRRGMGSLVHDLLHLKKDLGAVENRYVLALNMCLCRLDSGKNSYYYLSVYHLLMEMVEWLDWFVRRPFRRKVTSGLELGILVRPDINKAIQSRLRALRVVPSVLRVKHSAAEEVQVSSSERMSLVYDFGDEDDELVDDMFTWMRKYADVSFVTSSGAFSRSWEIFLSRCRELTASYQLQYDNEELCPKAGVILRQYMQAVEDAFGVLTWKGERKLAACIASFPLWRVLKTPPEACSKVEELLNSAYIGDFVNLSVKNKVARSKMEYVHSKSIVSSLENREHDAKQRYDSANVLLQERRKEKENKEAEQHLRNAKVEKIDAEMNSLQEEINQALAEEEEAAQEADMVNFNAEERELHKRNVLLKWELLNRILLGEAKNSISYDALHMEIRRVQSLLERARTVETKKKHEATLELMQDVYTEVKQAEKDNSLAKVWKKACTDKNQVESMNFPVLYMKMSSKMKERKAKIRRQQAEKKLSELSADGKQFREHAFETEVACKLAALKYEQQQKEVNELKTELDNLKQSLQLERLMCEAAKKIYDAAK